MTLTDHIDSLTRRLEAVNSAKDPEAKAYALRRLSNAAYDVQNEADRLADLAWQERCAAWDADHGYAIGPRFTRLNPPVLVSQEMEGVS